MIRSSVPNGFETESFGYDSNGNVTSDNDGVKSATLVCDELNHLATATDANGLRITYTYDAADSLKTFTVAAPSVDPRLRSDEPSWLGLCYRRAAIVETGSPGGVRE